jgi:hypothetical protein
MKTTSLGLRIFVLILTVFLPEAALGEDLFVATGGAGNGSSWDNPLGSIQGALNVSAVGDSIHVKQGTYHEKIVMAEWVNLYGGYSSVLNGIDISGRDPATYVTAISARGLSTPVHVVTGANDATIDGFALTGGADDMGGGMFNYLSSPTVANCVFSGNRAGGGGGMYNEQCSPVITNCTFSGNEGTGWGGGIYNFYASPTITNCTFSRNTTDGHGGGVFNWHSSPTVTHCILWGDTASTTDSEIYDYECTPGVTYCDVEDGYGSPGDNNIDQDPLFMGDLLLGGSWTEGPAYDSSTFQTTLTDDGASWTAGSLTGRLVNPNTLQELGFVIVTNTSTTIVIPGDATSLAASGDSYELLDYHLRSGSPCIDGGTEDGGPGIDFEGDPRPQSCIYDMGGDEFRVTALDSDGDGFSDQEDNCPCAWNPGQDDVDGDGVGDICDNCPTALNPDQTDTDEDGIGNACDVEVCIDRIVLTDVNNNIVTRNFSPGTNIRYKVKFTVHGNPSKLYKVQVNGKALSLYKPDGTDPEWLDNFDNPKRKKRQLYTGESKKVHWDRQIPLDATPGKKAVVRFTLRLREYDEVTGTWNLLRVYFGNGRKTFNIVP